MELLNFTQFMYGGFMMGASAIGIFFLKFWKKTGDRFFAMFASAFLLLAVERLFFLFIQAENEVHTWIFVIRLMAFVIISAAVVDKNRQ